MINIIEKIKAWYRGLPDRKPYIEFITALLTIPVLLTVILVNVGNLRQDEQKNKTDNKTATPVVVTISQDKEDKTPTPTPSKECEPEIGNLTIAYPPEGITISDNPVQFSIAYKKGNTCSVVWSYRVNGGRWSDYDDKSISIYNLPNGPIKFELRVKSVVSGDEKLFDRNFVYEGSSPTPTNSPTPTVTSTQ